MRLNREDQVCTQSILLSTPDSLSTVYCATNHTGMTVSMLGKVTTLLLLLGVVEVPASSLPDIFTRRSTTRTQHDGNHVDIDLSYKYDLNATELINQIRREIGNSRSINCMIEIDASSSQLNNADAVRIVDEILNHNLRSESSSLDDDDEKGKNERPVNVKLALRGNIISAVGARNMFEILSVGTRKHETNSTTLPVDDACNSILTQEVYVESLDLGFNNIGTGSGCAKALQQLIESENSCPRILQLDCCSVGAHACRAIGKALVNQGSKKGYEDKLRSKRLLRELYLSGNSIGDVGAASIAASLKASVRCEENDEDTEKSNLASCIEVLDLSSCMIGDAGAEALAMALEASPGCVRHINLSNNDISDEGASAIGRALVSSMSKGGDKDNVGTSKRGCLESIDLSGNKHIGDKGVQELAEGIKSGGVNYLSLRSCSIRAEGAVALGRAIREIALSPDRRARGTQTIEIDISGNQLGLAKTAKKQKGGFSAKAASASASSAISFIGKRIKTGLKDYTGIDVADMIGAEASIVDTAESDDEVEASSPSLMEKEKSSARCGITSFADALMAGLPSNEELEDSDELPCLICKVGFRLSSTDQGGIDALAALLVRICNSRLNMNMSIDATMNADITEEIVDELMNLPETISYDFRECAERHEQVLEILSTARERAVEAAARATEYARDDEFFEAPWEEDSYDEKDIDSGDEYGYGFDGNYGEYDSYDDFGYD